MTQDTQPSPDLLRQIVKEARNQSFSSSDDASPSQYVLAGWQAAIAAQAPTAAQGVPEEMKRAPLFGDEPIHEQEVHGAYVNGWNMCRKALLASTAALPLPVQAETLIWTDAAICSLLRTVGDGDFGDDDIATTRRFMQRSEEIRAELTQQPAPAAQEPLHPTVLVDWLAARYRAAGGKQGITDLSAFCEEVMRWTEQKHGITGAAK